MNSTLLKLINSIDTSALTEERCLILHQLIAYSQDKIDKNQRINLNFICTHNSRRSHLSQVWAQTMAEYFNLPNIFCYSGGTESTAVYPTIIETLKHQGFEIVELSDSINPIYALKYDENGTPIIAFSKTFDHAFNPKQKFAAIMTCTHADENCPFIIGAECRIPLNYEDPKLYDHSPLKKEKYEERSLQIATEMKYIFGKLKA